MYYQCDTLSFYAFGFNNSAVGHVDIDDDLFHGTLSLLSKRVDKIESTISKIDEKFLNLSEATVS